MKHLLCLLLILVAGLPACAATRQYVSKNNVSEGKSAFHLPSSDAELPIWNKWNTGKVYNNELEYYSPDAVKSDGEGFTLTASKQHKGNRDFVSGRVDDPNFPFEYGYVQATIKLPAGTGMFPALWLRPASGGILPEVDIVENIGRELGVIVPAYHDAFGGDVYTRYTLKAPLGLHTYTLLWTPNLLEWIVDGRMILRTNRNIPHQPMFVTINLAIGGTWPHQPDAHTTFPQDLVVQRIVIIALNGISIIGDRVLLPKTKNVSIYPVGSY